tara:strand:- start:1272 stop:1658 length:387 start_codon:yes stop_codon:yes gene_type:complete
MIKYYMAVGVSMTIEQPEQQEMTMPLLAATTTDGGVFIAGQAPHYGTSQESEAWMNAFDAEGETEINALFDNGDHVIVEVLTEMGLDKKEKKIGAKMVSVIRIPYSQIHFVKAGYLKGIPAPESNTDE